MEFVKIITPTNIEELKTLLKNKEPNTYILAGGTDLIIKLNKKEKKFFYNLIDLSRIKILKEIREDQEKIYIGSMATFTEISENDSIKNYASCLKKAAQNVGSVQIRNTATIGGNIANLSPAADSIPALLALQAKIKYLQNDQIYTNDLNTFINQKNENYCILEIIIPKKQNQISNFEKIGSRKQVTISKISIAAALEIHEQRIQSATVSLGAVSKLPIISKKLSDLLQNKKLTQTIIQEFSEAASQEVEFLTMGRASSEYKKEAVKGISQDLLNNLIKQVIK